MAIIYEIRIANKPLLTDVIAAQSTNSLLEYEDDAFEPEKFHYTTIPLKASPTDLVGTVAICKSRPLLWNSGRNPSSSARATQALPESWDI
ncbi:hypothetical protein CC78DRAFT_576283 [Lojkania enalia]|uniref:Uncharacterized protein n=1 Tax=Lojkania enalia TaxID=147567 RepID=A0A9P4N865_9PLEO|nr:hypothetical protein CC78DRAFT_576283 [Didymosphaeria enalia]